MPSVPADKGLEMKYQNEIDDLSDVIGHFSMRIDRYR